MNKNRLYIYISQAIIISNMIACKPTKLVQREPNKVLPEQFDNTKSTMENSSLIKWNSYFKDENLVKLISTALDNNQELNIMLQEIEMSKNEISAKKGEYLPSVGIKVGAGVDKVSRYTNVGAMEATTDITPGKEMPEPLFDFGAVLQAQWETDIWGKLRNAKKAQVERYLASVEGRNFMVTNIISEIAESYYELIALDNELLVIDQNIAIQNNVLQIIKDLQQNARSTKLAVKRFEAQILKTQSLQYNIQQQITETENRINYLLGRTPQPIQRDHQSLESLIPNTVYTGVPAQLLDNRADIRQAEFELKASKLDVASAKARFYPSLDLKAGVGLQAFDPTYLIKPESYLLSILGDLTAPLINKRAIEAAYKNANARQLQAVLEYEQTVLNAYIEVTNQLSKINNLEKSADLKKKEVDVLYESVTISNDLFKYAKADYMEVLLTQREALDAKFEWIEKKAEQLKTSVTIYRALGGGWNSNEIKN